MRLELKRGRNWRKGKKSWLSSTVLFEGGKQKKKKKRDELLLFFLSVAPLASRGLFSRRIFFFHCRKEDLIVRSVLCIE